MSRDFEYRTEAYEQHGGNWFTAVKPIRAGDEIYGNYGKLWFVDRGIEEIVDRPSKHVSLTDLVRDKAQCLSHLYIAESDIPMAGKGLFSQINFNKGDTVYISPALIIPKHLARKTQDENLVINYCISEDGSDVALLPIALSAMINHGGSASNIKMEWYRSDHRLNMSIYDLEALPFAPLEIRYVASRSIGQGEELLLDYGIKWHDEWLAHLERLLEWNNESDWNLENIDDIKDSHAAYIPQFREPIGAPSGFFPPHFKSDCIGTRDKVCESFISSEEVKRVNKKVYEASLSHFQSLL